jgi:hypothetical protein
LDTYIALNSLASAMHFLFDFNYTTIVYVAERIKLFIAPK